MSSGSGRGEREGEVSVPEQSHSEIINQQNLKPYVVIDVLRAQAWERAKGELRSVHATYYCNRGKADRFDALLEKFIGAVELDCLHE